jgi:predicted DNA binding CopG/RHH family protein
MLKPRSGKNEKEYDFSKATKNPYAKYFKKQVTIRLDEATNKYFKNMADELGMPYQTLINLYLRDCAATARRPSINWKPAA